VKKLLDLDGYVTGELTGTAADAFEEAMFDAPDEANIEWLDRIVRQGVSLVEHGTWDMGCTPAHLQVLRDRGHKLSIFESGPPGEVPLGLDMDPEAEFVVTKLEINRPDLARVDVEIYLAAYDATKTIRDAYVNKEDGAIYGLCERALAEIAWGTGDTRVRVRERDGAKALIAEWMFIAPQQPNA
jgi:hypothetical protein